MEKIARLRNHLTFLLRCRDNHVIPNGLRVTLPAKLHNRKKSEEITRRASEALLRALISVMRTKKVRMGLEIDTCTSHV